MTSSERDVLTDINYWRADAPRVEVSSAPGRPPAVWKNVVIPGENSLEPRKVKIVDALPAG